MIYVSVLKCTKTLIGVASGIKTEPCFLYCQTKREYISEMTDSI